MRPKPKPGCGRNGTDRPSLRARRNVALRERPQGASPLFRIAYNTNGLAHHRLRDALPLLADLGYEGVSITPDVGQLDLFDLNSAEVAETRRLLEDLGLAVSIETGARYLMDPRRKHYPTLLEPSEPERVRRIDFLRRSIDLAAELGAETCSFWAGTAPTEDARDEEQIWERLVAGAALVLAHGRNSGVRIAFEPEPGMFVERPQGFFELKRRLGPDGADLTLCLDVGHCHCTGDLPVEDVIRATAPFLGAVHLDDIRDGVHEHRMFGEGDLDLRSTLGALVDVGFDGLAAVELSRDSHRGARAAEEALDHVRRALRS